MFICLSPKIDLFRGYTAIVNCNSTIDIGVKLTNKGQNLKYLMLQIRVQGDQPVGSGGRFFKVFAIHGVAAMLVM